MADRVVTLSELKKRGTDLQESKKQFIISEVQHPSYLHERLMSRAFFSKSTTRRKKILEKIKLRRHIQLYL
jgi:hypothetical protein